MVRVGGGWDTLEHYLDKHDPCRCSSGQCQPDVGGWVRGWGSHLCGPTPHRPPIFSSRRPPSTPAEGPHLLPTEGVAHTQPPCW